jgi:hypothetical protein
MKAAEEKQKEEAKKNPQPYSGWPYKNPDGSSSDAGADGAKPNVSNSAGPAKPGTTVDVNKGGNGWPATDPSEFDTMSGGSGGKKGP